MAVSVNRVTLVGNLGSDPKTAGRDNQIVKFSVATSESWKDREGQKQTKTQWHEVVVYNEVKGKFVREYAKKGDLVYVEGRLETRKFDRQDGSEGLAVEIVVPKFGGDVQLQSRGNHRSDSQESPPRESSSGGRAQFDDGDDIPFAPEWRG